jgi:hypothetical protein
MPDPVCRLNCRFEVPMTDPILTCPSCRTEIKLTESLAAPLKGVQTFDYIDGIWVADPKCAFAVAVALRESLVAGSAEQAFRDGDRTFPSICGTGCTYWAVALCELASTESLFPRLLPVVYLGIRARLASASDIARRRSQE